LILLELGEDSEHAPGHISSIAGNFHADTIGAVGQSGVGANSVVSQNRPEAILIVSATSVALKKKASTQWTVPVWRILRRVKLTSAVCPEVPITQAK